MEEILLNRDEKFIKEVKEYIAENPKVLGKLFKIVSDNWNAMVEAQRNERKSEHLNALGQMVDNLYYAKIYRKKNPKLFSSAECCTLLDAINATDPLCEGGGDIRNAVNALFAKSCRALGWKPSDGFIKDVKDRSELLTNLYKNY